MNILKAAILCILLFTSLSCNSSSGSGPSYDLKGFSTESIGRGAKLASYIDQNNLPLAKGGVIEDIRNGVWTTYHANSNKVKSAISYINGQKNGVALHVNDRGSIESMLEYKNDELHGLSVFYKNGRTLSETTYKDGVMDGPFAVYDEFNGKIQRSGSFKDGKEHGELLFFDGEGNITMKYNYENGNKISGGIVK